MALQDTKGGTIMGHLLPDGQQAPHSRERLAYTINDAVTVSGLSRSTLYREFKAGRLRMVSVCGRRLVDAASLCSLLGLQP